MSAKFYCDSCSKEMKPSDSGRLFVKHGRFMAEIITCVDRIWNSGHLCHRCVRKIVALGAKAKQ